jgi:hypothetical protein
MKVALVLFGLIFLMIGLGFAAINTYDYFYGLTANTFDSLDRARERRNTAIRQAEAAEGTPRETEWLEKIREAERDVASIQGSLDKRLAYTYAGLAIGFALTVIGPILLVGGLLVRRRVRVDGPVSRGDHPAQYLGIHHKPQQ